MGREHEDSQPNRRGFTVRRLNTALYGSEAGAQHLSVAEAKRQMFAHQLARAGQPPDLRIRIGRGATVERPKAEARGRAIFAAALYDLVPESTARLVTPEALAVERRYQAAHDEALHAVASDPILANEPYSVCVLASESAPFAAALEAKWGVIEAWQREFELHDDWLARLAWTTMQTAWEMQEVGLEYRGPLGLGTFSWAVPNRAADASKGGREVVFEGSHPVYPVFVDDLKLSPDEAGFDMYDPDAEDVDSATARLLKALRPRVRRALQQIVAEHRQITDALPPVKKESSKAFQWLVRYQVLKENMPVIAEAEGMATGNISKEIHAVKDLIRLTLRKRGKSGPRRKPPAPRDGVRVTARARTVKLLR